MKTYEITFISKQEVKNPPAGEPIKDILTGLRGKILNISSIGEKQFAYKIKKENRGYYTSVLFEIEPEKISELNKKLSQQEAVLRFLIVAKKPSQLLAPEPKIEKMLSTEPKKIEAPKELEAPQEIESLKEIETPKKIEKPESDKPKKTIKKIKKAETPEIKPKITKEVTEIEKETESEEDRLKALDKKLDELLKE